jgi:DNA polymerase-3 subunit epsilon
MAQASRFVGDAPMVAHNASFDRRFWAAELDRLGLDVSPANTHAPYACTLLLSRRLYPEARSFRLGSLAAFHDLPSSGRAHRAMADAEVAAALLARIQRDLERRYDVFDCKHELLVKLQKTAKGKLPEAIRKHFDAVPKAAAMLAAQDAAAPERAQAAVDLKLAQPLDLSSHAGQRPQP